MKSRYIRRTFLLQGILLLLLLQACENFKTKIARDTDAFIAKYDKVEFPEMKNICIYQRSADLSEIVYITGRTDVNLPVYFVTYNKQQGKITSIDDHMLRNQHVPEYLSPGEIENAIGLLRRHNFFFLAVDSSDNLYVNPFFSNEPAYFLRLRTPVNDSIIRNGFVYEKYKGRWYLNSSRRKS